MAKMSLGKGLDALFPPNVNVNTLGDKNEINDASDLLLITTDGEAFENTETFWFQKFDTRDIFYQLRENGTYKIKYYGWREGFTNSFPNVLSVEQVVDENGTVPPSYNKYFGINLVGGGFNG